MSDEPNEPPSEPAEPPNEPPNEPPSEPEEASKPSWIKRIAVLALLAVLGLGLVIVAALFLEQESFPQGTEGPAAEALADKVEAAVDVKAWARTRAVKWTFGGRHTHLWDRDRNLVRVGWEDTTVLLKLDDQAGRAWKAGTEVTEAGALRRLLDTAYAFFCNDSFWLNPLAKLRDTGTLRSTVEVEGGEGLLIRYASGGVTPGDGYLWIVGADGLPVRYKMWAQILPVGGVDATWEDWITLSTGAKISTTHRMLFGLTLKLTDVAGATSLKELLGSADDPFKPLF